MPPSGSRPWMTPSRQSLSRCIALLCVLASPLGAQAPPKEPLPYEQLMTKVAEAQLQKRQADISQIQTRSQADARRSVVRAKLLKLIGGLPENAGPLNAVVVGTVPEDGFRIERVIYDSLPGYHVTANLYLPADGPQRHPAVLYHAGHGPFGKSEAFGFASNLARNGIAVLAYDPLGAGERLQARNPETGKSYAGPDEHSQAQIPISLLGDHVARYMLWDAMRGIDYLATRPDIDIHNIGSFGCSGGGTLSAYLTALDTRIKAGIVACYLTSYDELLKTIGPQDGEQVIPDFIQQGLDFPDLIELAAPRSYAMVSTTEDMFPFDGARTTHDEAARFYSLYGASDRLKWFTGPGHHGAIRPLWPQMIDFFRHALLNTDTPAQPIVTLPRPSPSDLQCTSTGQVTTGLPSRTIYQINRERAQSILPKKASVSTTAQLAHLQTLLKKQIPEAAGMDQPGNRLATLTVANTEQRQGYQLETVVFHAPSGMDLPAAVALPSAPGSHPALLITSERPIAEVIAEGSDFDHAAQSGTLVLAMTPLPWPPSPDSARPTMGTMLPWTSRAFLVGKTFVGMRTEDMLSAVEWLSTQHSVDSHQIDAYADGPSGVVLLHAAALDHRIHAITIDHALLSYQSVLDANVHRNITESVIPGVLLHYDLDDLMISLAPRQLILIDPVDGEGNILPQAALTQQLHRVLTAQQSLGIRDHIKLISHDTRTSQKD